MLATLYNGLLDLIFPPLCILCKKHLPPASVLERTTQICLSCRWTVASNRPPFCRHCSRPLQNVDALFCPSCQRQRFYFDQAWGACLYNASMRRIIHLFKYGHKAVLRYFMAEQLISFMDNQQVPWERFDCLIPIPLHNTRLRERGFNQAELTARVVSGKTGLPLYDHLKRVRSTRNQARLRPQERWTNIRGAFKIKNSRDLKQKNVLLVDDLFTTGATASEAALALKEAGAAQVCILAAAIANDGHEA